MQMEKKLNYLEHLLLSYFFPVTFLRRWIKGIASISNNIYARYNTNLYKFLSDLR